MAKQNTTQIYKNLEKLVEPISNDDFVYGLLAAYGESKSNITKLKNGTMNKATAEGQVIRANKILFQSTTSDLLFTTMEALRSDKKNMRHKPRFFVVTDYKSLLAYDTKLDDTLDIHLDELPKNLEFFMPWTGRERYAETQENPADVKAAERMARLYDEILRNNPEAEKDADERHKLNVFLSRLLFCFFAEDTNIFPNKIFSRAITELTEEDGSDLDAFLNKLFEILNTKKREDCLDQLCRFPYVNGGLFGDSYDAPKMTRRARRMILDCGALDWSEINPDIFGSMIQAVVDPEQRGGLGMHYTSVPNIMKVIGPLFLNEFYEELEAAGGNQKKLEKLYSRIKTARFFDPACGSGNFLIITYKEIRKLEMLILEQMNRGVLSSMITLDHFYGIELDDFAHEVAILSLWLVEHQMNMQFQRKFGHARPALPLREGGNIVCGNATRINWETICPPVSNGWLYIMGNPPYLGARMQDKEKKDEISSIYASYGGAKKVDYISCWFLKAGAFIQHKKSKFAFVSTNSICQGEHVALLWPHLFDLGLEIDFAHTSFKWSNQAKGNAAVICIVVGIRNISNRKKIIYTNDSARKCKNISPYLVDSSNVIVRKLYSSLSFLPEMLYGNMAIDGGNLLLSKEEKMTLIKKHPEIEDLVHQLYGAEELLKGKERYCLWIYDSCLERALKVPEIQLRIEKTKLARLSSTDAASRALANKPHQFREMHTSQKRTLLVPTVSSERRIYIPIGVLGPDDIIIAPNQAIYDPDIYFFGLLSSLMHMAWVKAVAGRLKTDYRYSSVLCYNTFPVPCLSKEQKESIEERSLKVLDIRDEHIGKTMANLYDPEKMPDDLREAHHQLDLAVDSCYRDKPFENDTERLELLFKMYEEMTA